MVSGIKKYLNLKYSDCIRNIKIGKNDKGVITLHIDIELNTLKFKQSSPDFNFFYRRRIMDLKNRVEFKKKIKKLFNIKKINYTFSIYHVNLEWLGDKIKKIHKDLSYRYPDISDEWDLLYPLNETFEELVFYYPVILDPKTSDITFFIEDYDLQVKLEFPYVNK